KSYEQWSAEAIASSNRAELSPLAKEWHARLAAVDPLAPADEGLAIEGARLFTEYLRACRGGGGSRHLMPPGRFLMPGELAGSPALTFAPLPLGTSASTPEGSLAGLMEKRFEAYKARVALPFFRDHFARLDRQIVLADVLTPLNAGAGAVADLEAALDHVLAAFRVGRNSMLSSLFAPRIE